MRSWLPKTFKIPPKFKSSQSFHSVKILSLIHTSQHRRLSSNNNHDLILNITELQRSLLQLAPTISHQLSTQGYFTRTHFLPPSTISQLRAQAEKLRKQGRYVPSFSEKFQDDGTVLRFDKRGVFACEPDGRDYDSAPDLISYIAVLLQTLPSALNSQSDTEDIQLSNESFNAKLAVTSPGGNRYPLHLDNTGGVVANDIRKLTCILYLNPEYSAGDGGDIRLFVKLEKETTEDDTIRTENLTTVDLSPEGGRILLFWSDEIPHEVLPTAPLPCKTQGQSQHKDSNNELYSDLDRYALTVWIPTDNMAVLHSERSKFGNLKNLVEFQNDCTKS